MRRRQKLRRPSRLLRFAAIVLLLLLVLALTNVYHSVSVDFLIGETQSQHSSVIASPYAFSTSTKGRQLIHVISPFHDNSSSTFQPLNVEQWSMLVSIQRARDTFMKRNDTGYHHHHSFDQIQVVCAVLQSEFGVLKDILSDYCDRIVRLSKSTATEYQKEQALPFLQEIVDTSIAPNQKDFYWMIANADICLTRSFYTVLEQELRERKAMALSINRMTVDLERMSIPTGGNNHNDAAGLILQADDMLKRNEFRRHPGFDCFIIHSSVLQMIHFGDMFMGYPPWGSNLHLSLKIMAKNYANIKSNGNGTFHLGNGRSWHGSNNKNSSSKKPADFSFWNDKVDELEYLPWCPISNHPPPNEYTLQNNINCGKWFRPTWSWFRSSSSNIPSFVQPGFEDVYIHNFGTILNYTNEGMPLVAGQPTPEIKQRVPIPSSSLSRLLAYISSGAWKKWGR
jgi:hypothetical protein